MCQMLCLGIIRAFSRNFSINKFEGLTTAHFCIISLVELFNNIIMKHVHRNDANDSLT